ncbi:MAG: flagellar biosynthetic protein FliR [Bryobacteraceae bacterium]|nr:flagellar biosynthetic protein FliR [Bryobacteraceae bacterium]
MRADLQFNYAALLSFLLVLARVSGVFALVPIPGFRQAPALPRVVLSVAMTFALLPVWPAAPAVVSSTGGLVGMVGAEALFGLALGVAVSILTEFVLLAMQVLGLQAGYSYASTIDPSSQADAGILQVIGQLAASLLFFAAGFDRQVIRTLALSFEAQPAGAIAIHPDWGSRLIHLAADIFTLGVRLAMPVVALLLLVDVALALLGRINAQLQLLSLAFPAKMLAAWVFLAATASTLPMVYQLAARNVAAALEGFVRR